MVCIYKQKQKKQKETQPKLDVPEGKPEHQSGQPETSVTPFPKKVGAAMGSN